MAANSSIEDRSQRLTWRRSLRHHRSGLCHTQQDQHRERKMGDESPTYVPATNFYSLLSLSVNPAKGNPRANVVELGLALGNAEANFPLVLEEFVAWPPEVQL